MATPDFESFVAPLGLATSSSRVSKDSAPWGSAEAAKIGAEIRLPVSPAAEWLEQLGGREPFSLSTLSALPLEAPGHHQGLQRTRDTSSW